jgi:hypothetical protein
MIKKEVADMLTKAGEYFADLANKGAAIKRHGRMCDDCAFRKGSEANTEAETLMKLESALYGMAEFNCHTEHKQDAGKPCVGFLHVKEYLKIPRHGMDTTTNTDPT